MNDNINNNDKLDWMYKSANSLVDREEYLLGRSVDKTLEQLNAEEKEKKLGLVPPKNHVEHECIPPSIRDFNKIVQAEQVDISAKLQEDPLVAIKKREEEARRQFLQNPVQLKKLQDALKAQESKKRKSKKKKVKSDSDSDLDRKIAKKLKYLKNDHHSLSVGKRKSRKSKDSALDTILMHKFNELKDKLSQDDLNDILAGKISDSDDEIKTKKYKSKKDSCSEEESDEGQVILKNRRRNRASRKSSSNSSSETERNYKQLPSKIYNKNRKAHRNEESSKCRYDSKNGRKRDHSSSSEDKRRESKAKFSMKLSGKKKLRRDSSSHSTPDHKSEKDENKSLNPDDDLERRILAKLRLLRDSSKSTMNENSDSEKRDDSKHKQSADTSSDSSESEKHQSNVDSDDQPTKPKTFGLVKADGSKIALKKSAPEQNKGKVPYKTETVTKPVRKNIKRLTDEEKERMRKEMMRNAERRDQERSENLKRYREEDKQEEKSAANFDSDFVRKQLLKSTKEATVESRIKSNLNNIQRSSRHMDAHFSKR